MPQVASSLNGEIVLWVIIGLLFIVAVFIAIKVFILPYFKAKQTNYVNDKRVIPSQVDAQIDQLRQQIDSLINDIDQFVSKSEPSPVDIPIGHGEALIYSHQQSNSQYSHNTANLFNIKFSKRIMNVLYFLRRRGIISEKEWEYINWITQPSHLNIDRILSLLEEYRLRLN
ncbi:hypothetical protein ACFLTQ_01565 [Chloroflexota bacterium]